MMRYCLITALIFIVGIVTAQNVQIHYLGHSSFIFTFDSIQVVCDYGKPNAWKEWGWDDPICDMGKLVPDIMTFSHRHDDHYDSTRIPNGVVHILKNGENLVYGDLSIEAVATCEDTFGVFNNYSYLFNYKGITVLHTGDIQTMIANIGNDTIAAYFRKYYPEKTDVLVIPIEGKIKYIKQAEQFIRFINPKIVIPSHYWSQEYLNEFLEYVVSLNENNEIYRIKQFSDPLLKPGNYPFDNKINVFVITAATYIGE